MELAARVAKDSADNVGLTACSARNHVPKIPSTICITPDVEDSFNDEVDDQGCIADDFKNLNVDAQQTHFLGRSSTLMLIRTAMDMKLHCEGGECPVESRDSNGLPARRPEFWDAAEVRHANKFTAKALS